MTLQISAIPFARLTPAMLDAWRQLLQQSPVLDSPFLRPEFTAAVATVRSDVEVAVFEDQGQLVGFLPFQRTTRRTGRPVGGRLSGYQALIAAPELDWDIQSLLQGCRLRSWHFDHWRHEPKSFHPFVRRREPSTYLDLSQGFETYQATRRQAGSKSVSKILARGRKLAREVGPLELEFDTRRRDVFDTLIQWNQQQFRDTGLTDVFAYDWIRQLLEHLLETDDQRLRPRLTVLYAGARPVAISYGLQSGRVMHGWFIGFSQSLAKYNPGLVMIVEMARSAAERGIERIEMGKGCEEYKTRLASGKYELAEGTLDSSPISRALREGLHGTVDWARSSSIGAPIEAPLRLTQGLRDWFWLH